MTTIRLRLWLVALVAGCLAACAGLSTHLESPKVALLSVQMLSTDMFAQKFRVRLKVENPNDLEMPVRGLNYQIFLMGDSFAEGSSTDQFLIPAKGEAEFDLPVTTNFVSSLGRLISRMGGAKLENIDYEIAGEVLVDKGMVRKIPFSHRGKVNFSRLSSRLGNGS